MAEPIVAPGRASAERRFFTGMALAILATVLVGFSRSFFLRPLFPDWPSPSEMIFYVHGAVFAAWIVLLVAQASLVRHRQPGNRRYRALAGSTCPRPTRVLRSNGLVRNRVGDLGFSRARPTASSHVVGRLAYHRFATAAPRRVEHSGLACSCAVGDGAARVAARRTS